MAVEVQAGAVGDFEDRQMKVLQFGTREIGIVRIGSDFHAYENRCPHAGGPVCQGRIISRVCEVVDDERRSLGFRFDESRPNIVCPWHGYEFDARSGEHQGHPSIRLRRVQVRVADGQLLVSL